MSDRHSASRRLEVLRAEAPELVAEPAAGTAAHEYRMAELAASFTATAVAGAVESYPADARDALLELHGNLVTMPGYREGRWPFVDALLAELERRCTRPR